MYITSLSLGKIFFCNYLTVHYIENKQSFSYLVARAVLDEEMSQNDRSTNSNSILGQQSRSFRYLQEQYNPSNGDSVKGTTSPTIDETAPSAETLGLRRGSGGHMPSRAFKILQDQYDAQQGPINRTQGINNRDDLAEIYNKRNKIAFYHEDY